MKCRKCNATLLHDNIEKCPYCGEIVHNHEAFTHKKNRRCIACRNSFNKSNLIRLSKHENKILINDNKKILNSGFLHFFIESSEINSICCFYILVLRQKG